MKIAQIDVNYQFSSTGKIVADLMDGLAAKGHKTMACFGRGPDPGMPHVHKISPSAEVMLHALGTRLTGWTGGYSPVATRRLLDHLEDFQPDVVHLHDLHGYFLNINQTCAYLKARRIPTLWTFHSEFMYTGKCGYAFDCERWRSECHHCPHLRSYPESLFFDFTTRMFREKKALFEGFDTLQLAAPSEWLARRMRDSVIVGGWPVSVVPNGLDTAVFQRRDASALRKSLGLKDEYIVLSVGSGLFSDVKGGKWVLELARRRFSRDVVFLMVGVDGRPQEVPGHVRLFPRIYDQELLSEYYSLADVLLLTSSRETFSMVCAESLACGTHVIGFDAGAPGEVASGDFGKFVPHGNVDALADVLEGLMTGALVRMPALECERFAKGRYAKGVMVDAYESMYQGMLDRH